MVAVCLQGALEGAVVSHSNLPPPPSGPAPCTSLDSTVPLPRSRSSHARLPPGPPFRVAASPSSRFPRRTGGALTALPAAALRAPRLQGVERGLPPPSRARRAPSYTHTASRRLHAYGAPPPLHALSAAESARSESCDAAVLLRGDGSGAVHACQPCQHRVGMFVRHAHYLQPHAVVQL